MSDSRHPYYFLDNLVKVLVVDKDPMALSFVNEVLSPVKLYDVKGVSKAADAKTILSDMERVHLCLAEMGISDIENDEFYLLSTYGMRVAFVMYTDCRSVVKGFRSAKLGAKGVIQKSTDLAPYEVFRTVNKIALQNIINPRYGLDEDRLLHSTDVLFEHSPKFVSQWALQMGITDRELRHIWRKNLGANAKTILTIYQVFSEAYTYYERHLGYKESYHNKSVEDTPTYRRLEEYFHCHRRAISDFISYGNVAAVMR